MLVDCMNARVRELLNYALLRLLNFRKCLFYQLNAAPNFLSIWSGRPAPNWHLEIVEKLVFYSILLLFCYLLEFMIHLMSLCSG